MQNLMAFQPDNCNCIRGGGGEGGNLLGYRFRWTCWVRSKTSDYKYMSSSITEGFYASLCNALLSIDSALHGTE